MIDDGKETVEVDMTDEQFMILAKMAHERDITLNALITECVREAMEREGKKGGTA